MTLLLERICVKWLYVRLSHNKILAYMKKYCICRSNIVHSPLIGNNRGLLLKLHTMESTWYLSSSSRMGSTLMARRPDKRCSCAILPLACMIAAVYSKMTVPMAGDRDNSIPAQTSTTAIGKTFAWHDSDRVGNNVVKDKVWHGHTPQPSK